MALLTIVNYTDKKKMLYVFLISAIIYWLLNVAWYTSTMDSVYKDFKTVIEDQGHSKDMKINAFSTMLGLGLPIILAMSEEMLKNCTASQAAMIGGTANIFLKMQSVMVLYQAHLIDVNLVLIEMLWAAINGSVTAALTCLIYSAIEKL